MRERESTPWLRWQHKLEEEKGGAQLMLPILHQHPVPLEDHQQTEAEKHHNLKDETLVISTNYANKISHKKNCV